MLVIIYTRLYAGVYGHGVLPSLKLTSSISNEEEPNQMPELDNVDNHGSNSKGPAYRKVRRYLGWAGTTSVGAGYRMFSSRHQTIRL